MIMRNLGFEKENKYRIFTDFVPEIGGKMLTTYQTDT